MVSNCGSNDRHECRTRSVESVPDILIVTTDTFQPSYVAEPKFIIQSLNPKKLASSEAREIKATYTNNKTPLIQKSRSFKISLRLFKLKIPSPVGQLGPVQLLHVKVRSFDLTLVLPPFRRLRLRFLIDLQMIFVNPLPQLTFLSRRVSKDFLRKFRTKRAD
jgi:hypothetical protein